MKKAKRLLAVLLAFVMICSAACVPVYAKVLPEDDYTTPKIGSDNRYKFDVNQGASYVLDLLDDILADADIYFTWEELGADGYLWLLGTVDIDAIDLTSVDNAVVTIWTLVKDVDEAALASIGSFLGLFGDLLKDNGLTNEGLNTNINRKSSKDVEVLYMVLNWLNNMRPMLRDVAAGGYDMGVLGSVLGSDIETIIDDPSGFLLKTLYTALIDDTATEVGPGMLNAGVQNLINWALVTGTGTDAATGANSILGPNAEGLMPAIGDQPGGASIYGETIQVDRNGDGVMETTTMSFYQLVNNVIQGLLNSTLVPMLTDVLYDALDIEITEEQPGGDPAILQDEMFVMITGLIESLAVSNGAPAPEYTEEDNATPAGKVSALLDWFFNGGGLDTFIKIDYYGFEIQDNFMSLLNDVARLAINLLPGLGLEVDSSLGYTADELNQVWFYDANNNLVAADAEGAVGQTYVTYENGTIVVGATFDDKGNPTAYNVLSTGLPLETGNTAAADYANPSLIRPNYVITKDNVYACLIKMVLDMLLDGCYFPEWADTMSSVLAYGLASIGVIILPENNYFQRLDLYHETGSTDPVQIKNEAGEVVETVYPIPYEAPSEDPDGGSVVVPFGAMKIGSEVGAFYLNGLLDTTSNPFSTNTTFEQVLTELVIWALKGYGPILIGTLNATTGQFEGNGMWKDDINSLITNTYSNYTANAYRSDAQWNQIYTFLDNTLFSLIPASWLPGSLDGSYDLFNNWLLNALVNFDLQQILGLFSINEGGELEQPVIVVLLRVIDRVFATVFNGTPLLLDTGRTDAYTQHTSIVNLEMLISSDQLVALIDGLVAGLVTYKHELCTTIFPLLLGTTYDKPYDISTETNYLGTDMTAYTVESLEGYLDYLHNDVNAELCGEYPTEDEAQAYIDSMLENDKYASYYIKEDVAETMIVDEEYVPETVYQVWKNKDYKESATRNPATDDAGEYAIYNNFTYSDLAWRAASRPYVGYDDASYRFYKEEDWKAKLYLFYNLEDSYTAGYEFASSYRNFPKSDLPSAYQQWMQFIIEAKLYAADCYDANGDGRSVISDTDPDYVAATTDADGNVTDPGFPVDSEPSIPTAMYPYVNAASTANHTYFNDATGGYTTISRKELTEGNFEQLAMAYEFATYEENYVDLDILQMEKVGRLALNTIAFDITADANGNYQGATQWEDLSAAQLTTIENTCTGLGIIFTYDTALGEYSMKMRPFGTFNDTTNINGTVSVVPVNAKIDADSLTYDQEIQNAIYTAYTLFVKTMFTNRKSLYNHIDHISDRAEQANEYRVTDYTRIDVTTLEWALDHVSEAYKSKFGLRNAILVNSGNGELKPYPVYTTSSYNNFREAYDYAESLRKAQRGEITATGVTQSMVSYAYQGLMDAFNNLVLYTGDADFTQLLNYIAIATDIKNDPNKDDAELGYTADSYNALVAELAEAIIVSQDKTIDCESQDKVDKAAAELYEKINALVYNTVPSLKSAIDGDGNDVVETIVTSEGARVIGHIFGLTVGEGVSIEDIEVVGMRIEEGVGNSIGLTDSGRGYGTGAYITGKVSSIEKFRFYAIVYGDINGDAMIDGTDRSAIELNMLQGTNNNADMGSVKFEAADVNHDGFVNASDANTIEQYYNYNPDAVIEQGTHNTVAAAVAE